MDRFKKHKSFFKSEMFYNHVTQNLNKKGILIHLNFSQIKQLKQNYQYISNINSIIENNKLNGIINGSTTDTVLYMYIPIIVLFGLIKDDKKINGTDDNFDLFIKMAIDAGTDLIFDDITEEKDDSHLKQITPYVTGGSTPTKFPEVKLHK